VLIFISLPLAYNNATAQNFIQDETPSFTNAKELFQNELKADSHLYTGKAFISYPVNIKGHPFFETDQMQSGEIFYDGTLYENVLLLFDIVNQQVIINRYNSEERIQLLNEKLRYFTFDGKRFENIFSVEGKDENVKSTIYEIMVDGRASLLVKRVKKIKSGLKAEDPTSFVVEDEFYIRKEKNLYAIDGRESVLEAFSDKKDLIKTFIRKSKFRFKKKKEKELIATVEYYSGLK
jgi:hypothetical protein